MEAERDALASELAETYPALVQQLADLFGRVDQNTATIDHMNGKSPPGESRRLVDAELKSRGLNRYTAEQPRLRDSLLLPDFNRPRDVVYPPRFDFSAMAALQAEGLLARIAARDALSCHAGWHGAKALEDEEKRAEAAKRQAQLAQEAAEKKRAFDQAVLAADRRRRGIIDDASAGLTQRAAMDNPCTARPAK